MSALSAPVRVGVFGGAFDPPHVAHRALAETALRALALQRLHIVPTGCAWHKARVLTAAEHRLAMCRLAFGDLPGVVIDRREIDRAGPSYTVDTLTELRSVYPGAQLFLLVGADQWRTFCHWHRWADILALATVVVAERAPDAPAAVGAKERALPHERLPLAPLDVSATAVRAAWQRGDADAARQVPPAVARYISTHGLYRVADAPGSPSSAHP
ncbi:nicotinate (nicotinamide) nucleotide adenylyltransferase [Tepidimonas sp.]|uniref:nicotinate (nicotinamide) nucleotide adenylyltransferase n=1 Tax=Tepidimonas sp. TaxID=2002775 RepID=UPI002FE189A6